MIIQTVDQNDKGKRDTWSLLRFDIGNEVKDRLSVQAIERRMPAKWRSTKRLLEPRSQEPSSRPSFHQHLTFIAQQQQPQPSQPHSTLASSNPRATATRRKWQRHVVGGRADNRPGGCAAFMRQHQIGQQVLFRASHRLQSTASSGVQDNGSAEHSPYCSQLTSLQH